MTSKENIPNHPKDRETFLQKRLADEVASISSLDELRQLVGTPSLEEQALLDQNDLDRNPPTPQKMAQLGPNLTADLLAAKIKREKRQAAIKKQGSFPPISLTERRRNH